MRGGSLISFVCFAVSFSCASSPAPGGAVAPAKPGSSDPTPPSQPTELVAPSADFDISDLQADATRVYWAHRGDRGIQSVAITGGPVETVVPATDHPITSLATDEGFLYWTGGRRAGTASAEELTGRPASEYAGHFEGFVARLPKRGTARQELSSGRFEPADVRVDGPSVYWVMVRRHEGTLVRLALGTESPSVVAHGKFAPGSLVVHGGLAYWVDPDRGPAVMMAKLAGEEPKKLAEGAPSNPVHPQRVAADDLAVYWTDAGSSETGGAIVKVPVAAGDGSLLAEGLATPRGIAVADGFVYWVEKGTGAKNFHDGTLKKVPATGGAPVTIASGLFAPDRVAIAGRGIVWTEVDGSVKVVAR